MPYPADDSHMTPLQRQYFELWAEFVAPTYVARLSDAVAQAASAASEADEAFRRLALTLYAQGYDAVPDEEDAEAVLGAQRGRRDREVFARVLRTN